MDTPVISVVITMYREGPLLAQAIESVLAQTFRNFEVVLVDNNCTPATREVGLRYVARYPGQFRIVHEPVQGVCSARNAGIQASAGEFIAPLDGDDLMAPTRLARQLAVLEGRKDLSMVFCGADFLDHVSASVTRKNVREVSAVWQEIEPLLEELLKGAHARRPEERFRLPVSMTTLFFRKARALEAGLFDPRMNPRDGDDWEFACRMFQRGGFLLVPEALAVYRMASPQSAEYKRDPGNLRDLYRQGEKFVAILWERHGSVRGSRALLRKITAVHLRIAGRHFMNFRRGIPLGRILLFRACLMAPGTINAWKLWSKSLFPAHMLPRLFWFSGALSEASLPKDLDSAYARTLFPWPPRWPKEPATLSERPGQDALSALTHHG